MTAPIRYTLSPYAPVAHLFQVVLTVPIPAQHGQVFYLPAWIPGSYMIRDFSKNILEISAASEGQPVPLTQLTKNSWQAQPVRETLVLYYKIYAFDLSVRGAYLDVQRGFYNGTSVFLAARNYEKEPCALEILPPEGDAYTEWKVATSLPTSGADKKTGFGGYQASSYDELVDHPVEMGIFSRLRFKVCGLEHEFVVSGRHRGDLNRLAKDTKRICEYQVSLFGEPPPFRHYVFMLFVGKDLYGGLEHRSSAALMANRDDLPQQGVKEIEDGYLKLLRLISHEYFHAWNIKRIKPAAFSPYDLTQENYTRLLWAFEGITSYYGDLTLVRCGLISPERYLHLLAETITALECGAGRFKQTLEQASFEAWTKYYKQDENSPNSTVSYYTKGVLVALTLDLIIRRDTEGSQSLDDVMRALWRKWLKDGKGLAEGEWETQAQTCTNLDLKVFFQRSLRGVGSLPLLELLAGQGIELSLEAAVNSSDRGGGALTDKPPRATLGIKTVTEAHGLLVINVYDDGAAQRAGISAGDMIIAIDQLRVVSLDKTLARYRPGEQIKLHLFRRDELISVEVALKAASPDTCRLRLKHGGAHWLRHTKQHRNGTGVRRRSLTAQTGEAGI